MSPARRLSVEASTVGPGVVSAALASPDGQTRHAATVRSDGERIAVVAAEPVAAQTGACWRLSLSGNTCLLTFSAEGTVVAPLLFQVACAAPACEALIGALAQ